MFERLMLRLGFVPEADFDEMVQKVGESRKETRALAHTVEAQNAEIRRMADRYQQLVVAHRALQIENAGVVGLLMGEIAGARS